MYSATDDSATLNYSASGALNYVYINWGKPERAPHWSVIFVYVGASDSARSVNKKIR